MADQLVWVNQDLREGQAQPVADSRLAWLHWASQSIHAACMNSADLLRAIHQAVSRMVSADLCLLYMLDVEAGEVRELIFSAEGQVGPVGRQPAAGAMVQLALERNEPLYVDDLPMSDSNGLWPSSAQLRALAGHILLVPLQSARGPVGVLGIRSLSARAFLDEDVTFLEALAPHVAIAIQNATAFDRIQRAAITAERQRLARDLHDSVTQLLYSMSLLSSGWKDMAANQGLTVPSEWFARLEEISVRALKEMRLLIHQLRPPLLAELGLVKALQQRLDTVERRVNIETRLLLDGEIPPLPGSVEEALYGIALEALNNALRHAEASEVAVQFRTSGDRLSLSVADNGVGFDQEHFSAGIGLQSMKERARGIGAEVVVVSRREQGTSVSVELALSQNKEGQDGQSGQQGSDHPSDGCG